MENTAEKTIYRCTLALAGVRLPLALEYAESAKRLGKYVEADAIPGKPIAMTETDWAMWRAMGAEPSAAGEVNLLPMRISDRLMEYDRFILHSAAFRWRDRAWLICAGSGVGKTTQLKTLLELYPEEIDVINGDRPVIEIRADGSAFVHPSPWNGKEGMYGAAGAPLGGIILLRRGPENSIERLPARKAAPMIYMSVFQCYETEASIYRSAALAEQMILGTSVWRLTNQGVPDSTRMLFETLQEEAETSDI